MPQELHSLPRWCQGEDFSLQRLRLGRDKNRSELCAVVRHRLGLALSVRWPVVESTNLALSFSHICINRSRALYPPQNHVDTPYHNPRLLDRTKPIPSRKWDSTCQVSECNVLANTVIQNRPTCDSRRCLCCRCVRCTGRPHLSTLRHLERCYHLALHKIPCISCCSKPSTGLRSLWLVIDCCKILLCPDRRRKRVSGERTRQVSVRLCAFAKTRVGSLWCMTLRCNHGLKRK